MKRIYLGLPSVIFIFSLQRHPAHVTVNPTAVTQRGESLARHRNCNLTQSFFFFPSLGGIQSLCMCFWLLCQQNAATQPDCLSHSDTLWDVVEHLMSAIQPDVYIYVFSPPFCPEVEVMKVRLLWLLCWHPAKTVGCMAVRSRMNTALIPLTSCSA